MPKSKDTSVFGWEFYEAVLQDAVFEWPSTLSKTEDEVKAELVEYLDKLFNGKYRIEKFYLRERGNI